MVDLSDPTRPERDGYRNLVVEEPDAGERHEHVVFVSGTNHCRVLNTATGLRNIANTTLPCLHAPKAA